MKKIYLVFIVFCLSISRAEAQYADINPEFAHVLETLFPGCTDGSLFLDTTYPAIVNCQVLNISGMFPQTGFNNLGGIQYFDNLRTLYCSNDGLDDLGYLPPSLDTLVCTDQTYYGLFHWTTLQGLGNLPAGLKYLDCSNNGIDFISSLPPALEWLDCSNNYWHTSTGAIIPSLQYIDTLPPGLKYLKATNGLLTRLPTLPPALEYLDVTDNKFDWDDGTFIYHNSGIFCLPTLPASLQHLYISGNSLTCLPNAVPGLSIDLSFLPICASPGCPAFAPSLTATPGTFSGLTATHGYPSASVSYVLSGDNLLPSSGYIIVESSTAVDVSTDNINFVTSASGSMPIPYSGGHLPPTTIYTRLTAGANGIASGPITAIVGNTGPGVGAGVQINGFINATGPGITAGPNIPWLTTTAGVPSVPGSYALSATGLTPASGNVTVTATAGLEISTDNINYSASPLNIPYTNGQLPAQAVYVRISASAPVGAVSGVLTNSGGGAVNVLVGVLGNVSEAALPSINAGPAISGLSTYIGYPSPTPGSYNLSASSLFPAAGNLTVTPGSGLEVSIDNVNFTASSLDIPYTGGQLPAQLVYVRFSASAPGGYFSGTVTNSGGGAANTLVAVQGIVATYSPAYFNLSTYTINGLTANSGSPSNPGTYILYGSDFFPVSGNLTVTASTGLEISIDNITYSTSLSVPYTDRTLPPGGQLIYVRISASAPIGFFSGTVTNSGGAVVLSQTVTVNGNVANSILPVINAGPGITGLSASGGSPSTSGSYILSAQNLLPASGNITVTGSSFLELSTDNINYSALPLSIPYSSGQLPNTSVYVRIAGAAPVGAFSGTVTNSGGTANDAIVTVNGGIARMYYNTKANLGLTNPATWSSTLDGTGPSPSGMNDPNSIYNIVDPANVSYSGTWNISEANSRIIIGDGINPITFIIQPGIDSITASTKVDVSDHAILRILNNHLPKLNFLADGSTVDFAQSGITVSDQINIPVRSYYNLKLTNGLKYISDGTTTVRNEFVADAVTSIGTFSSVAFHYPVLNCLGDVIFQNASAFDDGSNDALAMLVLKMNGAGPVQNIISNGTVISLLSLERDSSSVCTVNVSAGTELKLGSLLGGGLFLNPSNAILSTSGGRVSIDYYGTIYNGALGKINSDGTSFEMNRFAANPNMYPAYPIIDAGTFRLTPNSTIKTLKMNYNYTDPDHSDIKIPQDILVTDSLLLFKGILRMADGTTLNTSPTVYGGYYANNKVSFVDGNLKLTMPNGLGGTFTVGSGTKPAFVTMTNVMGSNNVYTIKYNKQGYGNYTIDPLTASLYPDYDISKVEYWTITPAAPGGTASIWFYYMDSTSGINFPNGVRIAHFDGADWNDLGGTVVGPSTPNFGLIDVDGINEFGIFSFSALNAGVVPVKLSSFSIKKQNTSVQLSWTTEQEINSKTFVVERSSDQHKWNEITRLNAPGNSNQKINYTTTDFNPAKGVNYYRLKQIDLDGKFNYSEIRSVYFGNDVNVVLVPNPASDKVNIYLPGDATTTSVVMYNQQGQPVKKLSFTGSSVQINIADLSKGIYLLKINGKDIDQTKKLLIE